MCVAYSHTGHALCLLFWLGTSYFSQRYMLTFRFLFLLFMTRLWWVFCCCCFDEWAQCHKTLYGTLLGSFLKLMTSVVCCGLPKVSSTLFAVLKTPGWGFCLLEIVLWRSGLSGCYSLQADLLALPMSQRNVCFACFELSLYFGWFDCIRFGPSRLCVLCEFGLFAFSHRVSTAGIVVVAFSVSICI